MSFFKDFKEDLSQAVNELIPENEEMTKEYDDNDMVDTIDKANSNDLESELDNIVKEDFDKELESDLELSDDDIELDESVDSKNLESSLDKVLGDNSDNNSGKVDKLTESVVNAMKNIKDEKNEDIESEDKEDKAGDAKETKEEEAMEDKNSTEEMVEKENSDKASGTINEVLDEETTYITKGTKIKGDLEVDGSIDIVGCVEGNVTCMGKLVVSGSIKGLASSGEIYANAAKIEGDISSEGSVKIGVGSMIIGNVEAKSAVIAGAVNGDIDVKGPVIVDSTAVVMGNIKSRSVQINNGAVIEGFCSQCYSDIDVKSFFA